MSTSIIQVYIQNECAYKSHSVFTLKRVTNYTLKKKTLLLEELVKGLLNIVSF